MTDVETTDRLRELEHKHNRDFEEEFEEPAKACEFLSCCIATGYRE